MVMDNNVPINRHEIKKNEVQNDTVINKNEKVTDEFAASFPEWNLLPPAVVIKRVRRRI